MYKLSLLALVCLAGCMSAHAAINAYGSSAEFGRKSDFGVSTVADPQGAPQMPVPMTNRLSELRRHYKTKTRLPPAAKIEHEASHEESESSSHDEHTSSGKNHNNRVSSKTRNKTKDIKAREHFNNNEEEVKQTPRLFHSKKSNTNYSKSYNKNKRENVADFDQDEASNSKFVHKKQLGANKMKKNHVKDANGAHEDSAEAFEEGSEEEYMKNM